MVSSRRALPGHVHGPRTGPSRDRRGRGRRGPVSLPGPLTPRGVPAQCSPRDAFDELVAAILAQLDHHRDRESELVEVAVEESPILPPAWSDPVPRSIVSPMPGGQRIVLYRLPLLGRARSAEQVEDQIWTVLLTRLGQIWGRHPDDLDPR